MNRQIRFGSGLAPVALAFALSSALAGPASAAMISATYQFPNTSPNFTAVKTVNAQPANVLFSTVGSGSAKVFGLGGDRMFEKFTDSYGDGWIAFEYGQASTNDRYITWSLQADTGYQVDLESVSFNLKKLADTSNAIALQVSTNNFGSTVFNQQIWSGGTGALNSTNISADLTALAPANAFAFRLVFSGALRTNSLHAIDNLTTTAVIPEPASLAVLGLGSLCLLQRRRVHASV